MEFELIPVIDRMLALYEKPLTPARFRDYLALLEGETAGGLSLPIAGFNPMAKKETKERLQELKALGAEDIARTALQDMRHQLPFQPGGKRIRMALNLSDDVRGGWTNRYTSDYDSKFRIGALLSRNFCAAVFWTSEAFSVEMIRQRVLEYAWRSAYRQSHRAPLSLEEQIAQETFVARQAALNPRQDNKPDESAEKLYQQNQHAEDYPTIFNFLYGSDAARSLAFPVHFVLSDFAGFSYAAALAQT